MPSQAISWANPSLRAFSLSLPWKALCFLFRNRVMMAGVLGVRAELRGLDWYRQQRLEFSSSCIYRQSLKPPCFFLPYQTPLPLPGSVVWAQARRQCWALPPSLLSLWRSLMGPGWLGFPSIMLGKKKGADRKMRLFQGIDSVTAMV